MQHRSAFDFCGLLIFLLGACAPFVALGDERADEPLLTVPMQVGEKYQLALVNLQGQVVGKVIESEQQLLEPAWSPDGSRLAYVTEEGGQPQIFVARADGSGAVNLTNSDFLERNPTWSPDGQQLAWTRVDQNQHSIWTMKADGSGATRISDPTVMCSNPSWSPDGKTIAYATLRPGDANFRVWQMNADGSDPRELWRQLAIRTVYPAWSHDGKQIMFGGPGSDGRVQLCICNADGEALQQLTDGGKQCSYASCSPDGQYVAYVSFDRWPNGYSAWGNGADTNCPNGELMLYDVLSGEHRKLLTGALPMYGPRPSWRARPAKPEAR
jgi:Tol biopolymer transport system component